MENFGSWSVLTTNFLLVLYLALGGIIFASMLELAKGKWRLQIRFIATASIILLPLAFVLLLILLFNGEATFPWLSELRAETEASHHFPGWHNYTFLVSREILGFMFMSGLSYMFVKHMNLVERDPSAEAAEKFRLITIVVPFAHVLYGTMVAWDFEMTLQPGWHSAEYGVYQFQSFFHAYLAALVILMFILDKSGRLTKPFDRKLYNYLAQFILGMTIMWVYFYFVQYLIFWYGRLPHDMDRYVRMIDEGYIALGFVFTMFKFVIPFGTFIWTPFRHNPTIILLVSLCVLSGTWIERYVWVSGSVQSQFYHMPMSSLFDIVVTGAIFVVSVGLMWWMLTRRNLITSGK